MRANRPLEDHEFASELSVASERYCLAALLNMPEHTDAAACSADDFMIEHHRLIFGALQKARRENLPCDLLSIFEICRTVDLNYLTALFCLPGAVITDGARYARQVKKHAGERAYRATVAELETCTAPEQRKEILQRAFAQAGAQ